MMLIYEFIDRYVCDKKSLFIADREYESFNNFEHIVRNGQYFLTRVKDINSSTSILKSFILPDDKFSINEIKELYRLRWGIETSFKELKYAVNLNALHAEKVKYISKEL